MEEVKIEKLTPHILVKSAMEASALYRELFGAEILADGEIKIGSQIIVITESAISTQPQRPTLCLRLESSDLASSVVKSLRLGCELVQNIVEDVYRPGVLIATISDPFGQIWELAYSKGGIGDEGFLNAVKAFDAIPQFTDYGLDVMLFGFTTDESEYYKYLFENYAGTPNANRVDIVRKGEDTMATFNGGSCLAFETIVCKVDGEVNDLIRNCRENLEYRGLIVGFFELNTPEHLKTEFTRAGGDLLCEKPSALIKNISMDWLRISQILLFAVKRMYREELNMIEEYQNEAARRIAELEGGLDQGEITTVTPQLVLRTTETCQFFEEYEAVFGAKEVRFSSFYGGNACSELLLGSNLLVVRDDPNDPDLRVSPQPGLFLELECSDLKTIAKRALELDWTKVEDDPTRVSRVVLKDPFGHVWHLRGCAGA